MYEETLNLFVIIIRFITNKLFICVYTLFYKIIYLLKVEKSVKSGLGVLAGFCCPIKPYSPIVPLLFIDGKKLLFPEL